MDRIVIKDFKKQIIIMVIKVFNRFLFRIHVAYALSKKIVHWHLITTIHDKPLLFKAQAFAMAPKFDLIALKKCWCRYSMWPTALVLV